MCSNTFNEVIQYHEATKHHFRRYARSPGFMDWKNQPHPFRTYRQAPVLNLPLRKKDPPNTYFDLYIRRQKPSPLELSAIAGFLELSLGLSAWKSAGGAQWALRMNPSSGNLHPTEAHLILPQMPGLTGGTYHYHSFNHSLEQRAVVPDLFWDIHSRHVQQPGFLIGLTSIYWREAWKYGERAFRYCNHDVGHALAALSFSGSLLGWKVSCLTELTENEIAAVLGLDKVKWLPLEEEHPDLLCFVHPPNSSGMSRSLPPEAIKIAQDLTYTGIPNRLSDAPVDWPVISQAAARTQQQPSEVETLEYVDDPLINDPQPSLSATAIIRQRRSAVSFDRNGSIAKENFLAILDKTLPRKDIPPFDAELMAPHVNLLLFVHQVHGLDKGLYFYARSLNDMAVIRQEGRSEFLWQPVETQKRLHLLQKGDFRQTAAMVSCAQEIAGDSAFSLGMIARFKETLRRKPFHYRQLLWETGMIGQVLYLEAEAHGVRGTGIGCFFDDPVHDILGLTDNRFQSLYHFTIGKPIEDSRLQTYPPYFHLAEQP
jgi:SagB-type dehydrogenase family enzyme